MMTVDESVQVQRLNHRLLVTEEVLRSMLRLQGVPDEVIQRNLDNVHDSAIKMHPASAR